MTSGHRQHSGRAGQDDGGHNSPHKTSLSDATAESVVMLLRLAFDRREAASILERWCAKDEVAVLRVGPLYRRLAELVQTETEATNEVETILAERFGSTPDLIKHKTMSDMANAWALHRDQADSRGTAAILWSVARSPGTYLRALEERILEDLNYRAVRSLASRVIECAR